LRPHKAIFSTSKPINNARAATTAWYKITEIVAKKKEEKKKKMMMPFEDGNVIKNV
jgi:hypothetical protein